MKALKITFLVFGVIILLLIGLVVRIFWNAGQFKSIEPHSSSDCRVISGVMSSEDITIHPQTGFAFISSDDRRAVASGSAGQGAIYGYDLKAEEPALINLTSDFKQEFHPHGLGLYIAENSMISLFVVNHKKDGHFIEIFDYVGDRLSHRESIKGPLMTSPNDVIPVGKRSFYVTNDHGQVAGFKRTLEEYLQLPWSYVLYCDGDHFQKVAEDLAYANGINISRDNKILYVAATISGGVFVYDRDIESGALNLREFIDAGTGVDNIEIDGNGSLWLGAHPKLLTFVKHSKDPTVKSPSQVLKITWGQDNSYNLKEIYLSDGTPLSGSSVAAVYRDTLLIGSVFEDRFLLCRGLN